MIALLLIVAALVLWAVSGIVLHHVFYARREKDYSVLGYALSVFPGPFVPAVLWWDVQR